MISFWAACGEMAGNSEKQQYTFLKFNQNFLSKVWQNILSQTTIIKPLQSWCFFIWRIPHCYRCTHLLAELSRKFWSSSGEEVWLALRNIITWARSPPSSVLLVKLCNLLPKNQSEISDDRNTVSTCNGWVAKMHISKPQETNLWLVQSHLSVCFCLFTPKLCEGGGDLRMIFCRVCECSLSSQYTKRWWEHSNLNHY